MYFILFAVSLVVGISATNSLKRLVAEMMYYVSSETLNPTHSLTDYQPSHKLDSHRILIHILKTTVPGLFFSDVLHRSQFHFVADIMLALSVKRLPRYRYKVINNIINNINNVVIRQQWTVQKELTMQCTTVSYMITSIYSATAGGGTNYGSQVPSGPSMHSRWPAIASCTV